MLEPRQLQANRLVLEDAKPSDVERVLLDLGMPMGLFQTSNLAGLDLGWNKAASFGSTLRDLQCERRRFGQKSGAASTITTPSGTDGAKILEEGIAQCASDINVVWVYGCG